MEADLRVAIVQEARACLDTPFALHGRMIGVALDCAGLLFHVANKLGLYVPVDPSYTRRECFGVRVYVAARERMDELPKEQPLEPGNVLLLWTTREKRPMHFGIWTGEATMVHAHPEARRVIESNLGNYWPQRIYALFDFRQTLEANHKVDPRVF